MAFELVLLGALIFIFIVSFCGLLQKIRQTYDRERLIAERIARRRERERNQRVSGDSFAEVYVNPAFTTDSNGGIFPAAPPPYSQYYVEPPPKYDEVIKVHQPTSVTDQNGTSTENQSTESRPLAESRSLPENQPTTDRRSSADPGPPPYTITLVTETVNRH